MADFIDSRKSDLESQLDGCIFKGNNFKGKAEFRYFAVMH